MKQMKIHHHLLGQVYYTMYLAKKIIFAKITSKNTKFYRIEILLESYIMNSFAQISRFQYLFYMKMNSAGDIQKGEGAANDRCTYSS